MNTYLVWVTLTAFVFATSPFALLVITCRSAARHRVRFECPAESLDHLARALQALLQSRWRYSLDAGIFTLLQILRSAGRRDVTIRACPPEWRGCTEPLAVTFEPSPLDERDHGLQALLSATGRGGTATHEWQRQHHRRAASAFRAALSAPGSAPAQLVLAFFVLYANAWTESWLWIYLLGLGATVAWQLVRPSWHNRLVVPGGLVLRRARWFHRRWRCHLFERRESVLCVCAVASNEWWFAVTDGIQRGHGKLTDIECEALLRAWCSPLPSPPAHRLSDLL